MSLTLLAVGGGLALALLAGGKKPRKRQTEGSVSDTTTQAGSWIVSGDPVLYDKHRRFLDALAARLGRRLVVSSGVRTPERQARAMLNKLELGDDLALIYNDDLLNELLAVPSTVEDWTTVLESQVERGFYISDHMRGDAVDLRIVDADGQPYDEAAVKAAAQALGVEVLFETLPPHIHFEEIH